MFNLKILINKFQDYWFKDIDKLNKTYRELIHELNTQVALLETDKDKLEVQIDSLRRLRELDQEELKKQNDYKEQYTNVISELRYVNGVLDLAFNDIDEYNELFLHLQTKIKDVDQLLYIYSNLITKDVNLVIKDVDLAVKKVFI